MVLRAAKNLEEVAHRAALQNSHGWETTSGLVCFGLVCLKMVPSMLLGKVERIDGGAAVGGDHKWKRTKLLHQQSARELLSMLLRVLELKVLVNFLASACAYLSFGNFTLRHLVEIPSCKQFPFPTPSVLANQRSHSWLLFWIRCSTCC